MTPQQVGMVKGLARVLLGSLFVIGGVRHLPAFGALRSRLARRGVPLPRLALGIAAGFQTTAGALPMAGLWVSWMALGLIGFTVVASWLLLDFWTMVGEARAAAMNQFLTNIAVIGGLLYAGVATT